MDDLYYVKASKHLYLIDFNLRNGLTVFSNQCNEEVAFEYYHQALEVCLMLNEKGIDCYVE